MSTLKAASPSPVSVDPSSLGADEYLTAATPESHLVFTNHVYVPPTARKLLTPCAADQGRVSETYIIVNDRFIFVSRAHKNVTDSTLGLSSIQREALKVSQGGKLRAVPFHPPTGDVTWNILTLKVEVDVIGARRCTLKEDAIVAFLRTAFVNQIFSRDQSFCADFEGTPLKFTVKAIECPAANQEQKRNSNADEGAITQFTSRGILLDSSNYEIEAVANKYVKWEKAVVNKRSALFKPNFRFADMGIGGLDSEFGTLFRRAFASRLFPPKVVANLGIKHVKGVLLYGPPGTGKTLIARQIGKLLAAREPKIVNGPEILSKFVGDSEKNIRELFADAEKDYKENKENADLHIIIFDEIDAICKARGRSSDSTGVGDTVVNQILTKMDGVDQLDNVLVIGMTNRKELIDVALLRPGRFEVHIEINLPDEAGRIQILNIHLKNQIEKGLLTPDVSIPQLAAMTKNFSGAELAGLVRSAVSFALNAYCDVQQLGKAKSKLDDAEGKSIRISMEHFLAALDEVHPAFGVQEDELATYLRGPMFNYGVEYERITTTCKTLIKQVQSSNSTPLLSVLLEGPAGSGKSALAARLAKDSGFAYVKVISPEQFVGATESRKCNDIAKVFEDSYKSPLSLIILDNIERLLEYVSVGPRFSQQVLQSLIVLATRVPPVEGRKLMVIGTTSKMRELDGLEVISAFNVIQHVPSLTKTAQVQKVLDLMKKDDDKMIMDSGALAASCSLPLAVKQLLLVVEMSKQQAEGAEITTELFNNALKSCGFGDFGIKSVAARMEQSRNLIDDD